MINVLFYALPNRNAGGLSVVRNLYHDFCSHEKEYNDIHFYIITSVNTFESTSNITVSNEEWALKTWGHRLFFNKIIAKRFIKKHHIDVIISLNMNPIGGRTPYIISMHNVLPLYHCGFEVFDSIYWILKQALLNTMMIKSFKRADAILIPSNWIKQALMEKIGIREEKIFLSQIPVPEMKELLRTGKQEELSSSKEILFVYPSASFLYKNHMVILKAVKELEANKIKGYRVLFTGYKGKGKTVRAIKKAIIENDLPIEIKERISSERLAEIYKEQILVFPSKIETDAFPLLESVACGGEIISADFPYSREALKGYNRVNFFDADDYIGLAEIMRKAIENHDPNGMGILEKRSDIRARSEIMIPIIRSIVIKQTKKSGIS